MAATPSTTAEKLRAVADLLDTHPDLPAPYITAYSRGAVEVTWQLMNNEQTKDDQRAAAIRIRRALGGEWTKSVWDDRFDLYSDRNGIELGIVAHRDQVCERVVVGVETVTVPAVEAQPERSEEREVVEWRCEPLLDTAPTSESEAVSA